MVREEAIKMLRGMKADNLNLDDLYTKDKYEALDMAIKALEQEPCEDAVSRKELMETYNSVETPVGYRKVVDMEVIKNMPPVTPIQRWIPCSERLPEEDKDYLLFGKVVEDEENNIFIGEYDSCGEQFGVWIEQFDRTTLGCLGSEFYEYASVLAWMPLPEPYKAEMESEE